MDKKKLTLITIVILLVGVGGYLATKKKTSKNELPLLSTQTVPSPIPIIESEIYKTGSPFDFKELFKDETSFGNEAVFINPSKTIVIQFKDLDYRARNPKFAAYLNGKKIGEIGGQGMAMAGFSPDGKYFALRARSTVGCAGMCQSFIIYVLDLEKGEVISIYPPKKKNLVDNPKAEYVSYIESYEWGIDSLKFTTTLILFDLESGKFYEVSPKEVWQFNLLNKQYSSVEELSQSIFVE